MSILLLPGPQTKDASVENNDSAKKEEEEEEEEDEEEQILPGSTLFIKNLNFNTSEETLREVSAEAITTCVVWSDHPKRMLC